MGRPKQPARKPSPPEFIRPIDAASILSVSYKTLEHWRAKRVGPPVIRKGKYVRYEVAALRAWMRDGVEPGGAS